LYDVTAGSVRVDQIDVRDYDPDALWSTLGLVPQRGYLFSGTVADNLQLGAPPGQVATEEQMWEALRVAAADDFVRGHPDGVNMRIAQAGINLSGGQRQRLAIARAVIRRPAIYLLDDALSALDVHTDARVRAALRTVSAPSTESTGSAGATVIIVAQRVSTVADADQIVVLDAGRVVGVGTHDELLVDCPVYAELVDSQCAGAGPGR
jgi:ABC-type multidrug transport system fused ATPase/permease subunit